MIEIQVLFVIVALIITIFGIIRSTGSWNRMVIYGFGDTWFWGHLPKTENNYKR